VTLSGPVRYLRGVGEARERALSRLGIKTVEDLLFFFPRRYEDRRTLTRLSALVPNTVVSVVATVVLFEKRPTSRRGLELATALLSDGSDVVRAVWFNMPRIEDVMTPGRRVALYGRVEKRGGLQLTSPEFEILDEDDPQSVGRIVPVYPATAGLPAKWIRRIVQAALAEGLSELEDFVPLSIRQKYNLAELSVSVSELHCPQDRKTWLAARNRLAFDELFLLQTGLLLRRQRRVGVSSCRSAALVGGDKFRSFMQSLPFQPTGAQYRAIREIAADLASGTPMHRLLQGDVGSGKTMVAAASLLIAVDGGVQSAFMVPTEILAQQHFFQLRKTLSPLGVSVELLTASLPTREKKDVLEAISSGAARVVVGTHAIFGSRVVFNQLGLVVVDEQHRFGVLQKNALQAKGHSPHVLVMTATPIPRTLTLSIYGDLDVSVLNELPPGRTPVKTVHLRFSRSQMKHLRDFIQDTARRGRQAYWVCPLIEESENLDLAAALSRFQALQGELPGLRVALLHGQLSAGEKESVMRSFGAGDIDLLVATSVIEVGVDVPNATVMVIEDAARFGVAQLHQLRGRVGRGSGESLCVLLTDSPTPEGAARIEAILSTSDGFRIAELDLRQRGPGTVCGVRQHGVTDFRVADLARDQKLLELARREAEILLGEDPELQTEPLLRKALMSRLGATLELAGTA
jgi:ATP-dependent DNA helicase RecG